MRQSMLQPSLQRVKTLVPVLVLLTLFSGFIPSSAFAGDENIMMLNIANSSDAATGKTVQAKVMIDAPPNLVWQTITNYPEIKHIYPGYDKSTVLKANGSTKTVDFSMKVAPFLPAYHYQAQMKEDQPSYNLNVKRISGDFKSLTANYKLVPQNNGTRTLMIYNLNVDTGMNLPGSQMILKANTEKSLSALNRYLKQEAHKSLIGQR